MACERYCFCSSCVNDIDCSLEHYGDGSPWCGKFQCNFDDCARTECISYEEQLEEYLN